MKDKIIFMRGLKSDNKMPTQKPRPKKHIKSSLEYQPNSLTQPEEDFGSFSLAANSSPDIREQCKRTFNSSFISVFQRA